MPTSENQAGIGQVLDQLGANEGYGEELFRLYQANHDAVPEEWRALFAARGNGRSSPQPGAAVAAPAATAASAVALAEGDSVQPLQGAAARLAANMAASLSIPTATSQRTLPVAQLEAVRAQLNRHLAAQKRKLSMTPLLAWALVRALDQFPGLNDAYGESGGKPARIVRAHVNLGLAVDVERGSGRSLLVPVVKRAETLDFDRFAGECDRLIQAARSGKIPPDDLQGATISLTNPGTIGTRASVPRLMAGQAVIVAAGAVAYPAGFEGTPEATLKLLGVGKVVTLSCTYDHRIVQGAESGAFLARVHALLTGEDGFYQRILADLGITAPPARPATIHEPASEIEPVAAPDAAGIRKQAAVFQLARGFRVRGHLEAATDPLRLRPPETSEEIDPAFYGFTEADLDQPFLCPLAGRPAGAPETCTLRDMLGVLRASYCGTLGLEFMHLQHEPERTWLQEQMEGRHGDRGLTPDDRRRVLARLTEAEEFEHLLHARFVGHKRFSLEGAEALIPALDHLLTLAARDGVEDVVLGMSHRGRLNVLVTVLGLSMSEMFSKFEDLDPDSVEGSGDVKYHIGASGAHQTPDGARLPIELIANPSHLEAVDPVVEGSARARQELRRDERGDHDHGRHVLPLLIHGDAAFAGQGVVVETLNLSQLGGYRTGGTVHIIVNNQIGFTTSPVGARSSLYSTDVARTVQAPIFHVNGDDPEAVVRAAALALEFRRRFHKDVVVDMVCYRRHGHNEADDPSLTSPVLYRNIESHPSVRTLYADTLTNAGLIKDAEAERAAIRAQLEQAAASPATQAASAAEETPTTPATDVTAATLATLGERLTSLPPDFHLHPKLRTFLDRRRQATANAGAVDWSLAEALALGSLALEQTPVRLAGQDSGRGTFSQRHALLYDHQDGRVYIPLTHLDAAQAPVAIYDSLLSEEAALGFEFGYASTHPSALVLWEAQFGDFVNGAQVVIDQFLASSDTKWGKTCGLTLLLPHGFEGQGPEHSSARMERFLQLSADGNWRLANCTTAAQYFHLLRNQGLRRPRRPLVIFTPKSLLRHPDVASPLAQLTEGNFQPVIADTAHPDASLVLLCSGKVYYDLIKARAAQKSDAAIIRIEQLYPLPEAEINAALDQLPQIKQVRWVQEEPQNMGAASFMASRLPALCGPDRSFSLISRPASPSPATGSLRRHQQEQSAILTRALAP